MNADRDPLTALRDPRTSLLVGAISGAGFAGFWWFFGYFMVDRFPPLPWPASVILDDLSWLSRRGDPLSRGLTFAIVGAVLGAVVGLVYSLRSRAYERAIVEQSASMGFTYQAEASKDDLPDLPVLRDWSSARNRMTGRHGEMPVEVIDFTSSTQTKSSEGETSFRQENRTLVLLPSAGLPEFDLIPRNRLARFPRTDRKDESATSNEREMNSTEAEILGEFERGNELTAAGFSENQSVFVQDVFTPEVMAAFLGRPGWSIQSRRGFLALWRGRGFRPARERPELVGDALAIRDLLTRVAAQSAANQHP